MSMVSPSPEDLSLPRILCLHGGGVNSDIFRQQARALIKALPTFRLVFADGPFFCDAGPGIVPVYADQGPFRRWLRWRADVDPNIDDESAATEIFYAIDSCKNADRGSGPWVGLLGFSQGGKVAASILFDQQCLHKLGCATTEYKFVVLLAARSPLVSLRAETKNVALVNAGDVSEGFHYEGQSEHVLAIPSIHIHGSQDPGMHLHKKMLEQYCDPDTSSLVQWDGDHRVPIKKVDVDKICAEIYRVARREGISC